MVHLRGSFFVMLFFLALPAFSLAQPTPQKKKIKKHLLFNGRELKGPKDSLGREELISWLQNNKVTVGHTDMQIVSFQVRWLSTRSDYKGPYPVEAYDATGTNQKMADMLKKTLAGTNAGDEIFIDDIRARKANGKIYKVAHGATFFLR